jgi:polyisoprenoid-binding protein YceI
MKRWLIIAGLAAALSAPAMAADKNTWQIDVNQSTAQFTVRHLGISNIKGGFSKVSGTVVVNDADMSKSSVNATIDVSSLDSGVTIRDNDLKSDHFFDLAKFPTMTFESTKIWKTGNGKAKMAGNLTIHGVTKEVTFDVAGPTAPITAMGSIRRGAEATAKISRKDFGMTYDPGIVGDQVSLTIDLEMSQPAPGGAAGRGPGPGPAPGGR